MSGHNILLIYNQVLFKKLNKSVLFKLRVTVNYYNACADHDTVRTVIFSELVIVPFQTTLINFVRR